MVEWVEWEGWVSKHHDLYRSRLGSMKIGDFKTVTRRVIRRSKIMILGGHGVQEVHEKEKQYSTLSRCFICFLIAFQRGYFTYGMM